MDAPAPGTRWVKRNGKHTGDEVEVLNTSALSVSLVHLGGGDASHNVDRSRVNRVTREAFVREYMPREALSERPRATPAFRQNNLKRRAVEMRGESRSEAEATPAPASHNGHHISGSVADSGLSVGVQLVTPEQARTWLERGGANRRLSERRVLQLLAAIAGGQWRLTGDSIKLDSEGRVRDGQHRLEAIARSGRGVECLVVRNVTEAAFDVIDTGRSRTAADVLSIHGHINTIALAAAARNLLMLEQYGRIDVGGTKVGYLVAASPATIRAYVDVHPEIHSGVIHADRLRKTARFVGGSGMWATALTLFWRINPEQTVIFVDSLIEGAGLERGSPILRLRNMYQGDSRAFPASTANRERLLAIIIKAWNAWRRDETVQQLQWHDSGPRAEKFPEAE